jgi:hypothetical protein
MAVKGDPDSGRKFYHYVATRTWREIAPATQIQWNECIIRKLVRMAGASTAQAEFLLPIMETGGGIELILTEIFYGQATGLLSFINRQELFFTHYSFHGLFIGKVTEEWSAIREFFEEAKVILDRHKPSGYSISWNVDDDAGQHNNHAHLHIITRFPDEPLRGKGIRWVFQQEFNRRLSEKAG